MALLGSGSGVPAVAGDVPPPAGTTAYGQGPAQVYDVRLPTAPRGVTVLVLHGGFWRAQWDRAHAAAQAQGFADHGYHVAVLEYRRVGMQGGGWPGTFEDVREGVAAVAADRRLPPRVVAVGHSAGGHLAAWAAALPGTPLAGAVSLAGCVDLTLASRLQLGGGAVDALMGGSPYAVPDRYAGGDPARLLPSAAEVALIHGDGDEQVPPEVSESYRRRAGGAGQVVALRVLAGAGHYDLIDPGHPAFARVLDEVDRLAT